MKLFFKKKLSSRANPFVARKGEILDEQIQEISKKRWVEEAWTVFGKNGLPLPLTEFLGISISSKKIKILRLFSILLILVLIIRVSYLQLYQGNKYRDLAEENRLRLKIISAERGVIHDRQQIPLTANDPSFTLVLNLQDLPKDETKLESMLKEIAAFSNVPLDDLKRKTNSLKTSSFQSIPLIDNLDYAKAINLMLKSSDWSGLSLEQGYSRSYLFSSLSHILGYTGKINRQELEKNSDYLLTDFIGKTGLEKSYEKELRGIPGQKAVEVDAFGQEKDIVKIKPPQAGKSLILTIDLDYQKKIETLLEQGLRNLNKKKAAAIVLNPRTGEILAMASLPSFDNNSLAKGISAEEYQKLLIDPDAPLFSRAWSGQYPSGSTIKPVIAAAALNEKIITSRTSFLSIGGIQVDRWFFPDWKTGGHGPTNVVKALAESVNTFFYYVGGGFQTFQGLGLEKIIKYLKLFGFGQTLGLDVPNESAGFIPTKDWKKATKKETWYIGDTYNLSIGQGDLLVTPLQIACMTAAISNGGVLYKPYLVKEIINPIDNQREDTRPIVLSRDFIPDHLLAYVREGMRQAVVSGSARFLADLPVKVAGKTGTAQWSKKEPNHAWFTSFAPFDQPEIILTILIEEGGEGSGAAVPIAKEFYKWWYLTKK